LNEIWHGVHQLQAIKPWSDRRGEENLGGLSAILSELHRQLFRPGHLKLAAVGDEAALRSALPRLAAVPSHFPSPTAPDAEAVYGDGNGRVYEGWQTSTAVNFVAQAFRCVRYPHGDAPALAAMAKMLRSLYLHREIREKGGAYGGFALYNPEEGLFALGSYRDPHIVRTLETFDGARDFIISGDYTDDDITEAVLQVCADIDKPDAPGTLARKAFFRRLVGLDDDARQQFKARLLDLDRKAITAVAERYFGGPAADAGTAVIASEEAIDRANAALTSGPLEKHVI
jgi:hypothetical protein